MNACACCCARYIVKKPRMLLHITAATCGLCLFRLSNLIIENRVGVRVTKNNEYRPVSYTARPPPQKHYQSKERQNMI